MINTAGATTRPSAGPTRPFPIRCRPPSSVPSPSCRRRCSGRRSRTPVNRPISARLRERFHRRGARKRGADRHASERLRLRHLSARRDVTGRVLQWSLGDLASRRRGPGAGHAHRFPQRDRYPASAEQRRSRLPERFYPGCDRVRGTARRAVVTLAALLKTADVLEVGLGETAPFTLAVSNTGALPLADLRIVTSCRQARDSPAPPEWSRFGVGLRISSSLSSSAGPLAPGELRRIRYSAAVVSATAEILWNTAVCDRRSRNIQSVESRAGVRLRRSDQMATRAAIGTVWLDRQRRRTGPG